MKKEMDSKTFVFILFCYIFIILFLYYSESSNNITLKQQSGMVKNQKVYSNLKFSSNELGSSQEQDLRQWMAEKEEYIKKDKDRIQEICQRYNVTRRKLIDKEVLNVDRDH